MTRSALLLPLVLTFLTSSSQAASVYWQHDWNTARQTAARLNKPVLLLATASWCGPCHRMLDHSFRNSAVAARVNARFVPLVIDVDQQSELAQRLHVESMPTMIVLDPRGQILCRHSGYLDSGELNSQLAAIPAATTPNIALSRRPLIHAGPWLGSRRVWAPLTPPWATPASQPVTVASPEPPRLAKSFPGLQRHDTLWAAKSFGAIQVSSTHADWGIANTIASPVNAEEQHVTATRIQH